MDSIFGNSIKYSLFGESHQEMMGITIHGLKAGIKLDEEFIKSELIRRKPLNSLSNARIEEDEYKIISGIKDGYFTGAPFTVIVYNRNFKSDNYEEGVIRPSHADYPAYIASNGYYDNNGGGPFSGRLTVLLVIAGAIAKKTLENNGISITSKILNIGNCFDEKGFLDEVKRAKDNGDSVGGTIEIKAIGVQAGIGEPFFNSLESVLAHLFFSVPACKAVEFGLGTAFSQAYGSKVNDEMKYIDEEIKFLSNNNGGINGGLSNGEAIVAKVTIKPTPTISHSQKTINIKTKENIIKEFKGNHDSCIALRAGVVLESVMAIGILDLLITRNGRESLK